MAWGDILCLFATELVRFASGLLLEASILPLCPSDNVMLCAGQRANPPDGLHATLQHLHPDLGSRGLPQGRLPAAGCRCLVWRPAAARHAAGHVLRRGHMGEGGSYSYPKYFQLQAEACMLLGLLKIH